MALDFTVGIFKNGQGVSQSLSSVEKPIQAMGSLLVGRNMKAYSEGGHQSRGGTQWAPWSAAYARDRARKGRTKILVDSGILRNSLTFEVTNVTESSAELIVGTNVSYAAAHQDGVDKVVFVKEHIRRRARKRGKWVKDKKTGNMKWRKGAKFKDATSRKMGPRSYHMRLPRRPVAEVTPTQDVDMMVTLAQEWADRSINGGR